MSPAPRRSAAPAAPARRGGRRGGLKGRWWLMLWLALFLLVAWAVQYRQSQAAAAARELRQLETARGALEVTRATLAGRVHRDRSRAVLVPLAQRRLGLRLPQDSEIVILQEPAAPAPRP